MYWKWINLIGGGALATCLIWQLFTSRTMRQRVSRALFRVGYFLYANTRCGRWLNDRNIRKAQSKLGDEGHSQIYSFTYESLEVCPVPCMFDNYAYVISDTKTNDVVIVDAGDGQAVSQFLEKHSMVPKAILTTHKHWDHCGGNALLKKRYPKISIYGSVIDRPDGVTSFLNHAEQVTIGSLEFTAYSTPGHTKGHMVYLLKGENQEATFDCLFTGDLLFLAGTGKLFEGTAAEMLNSLQLVCNMPDSTLIWPGHEYAVADLLFTCSVDADNGSARDKLTWAIQHRQDRLPTCPSSLEEEKRYNLFLRTGDVDLLRKLGILPSAPEENDVENGKEDEIKLVVIEEKQKVEALQKLRNKKD